MIVNKTRSLKKNWFLIAIFLVIVLAFIVPDRTLFGSKDSILKFLKSISRYLIAFTFIVSGIRLNTSSIITELRNVKGILFGIVSIFLIGPIIAIILSKVSGLTGDLALGMVLVAAMPTTVISGIIITTIGGGNVALALCITVVSNMICPLSVPLVLKLLASHIDHVNIDILDMMLKLFKVIVVPFLIGQFLRPLLKVTAEKIKGELTVMNRLIVLSFIFTPLCGSTEKIADLGPKVIFLVALVLLLHLIMLCFTYYAAALMKFDLASRKALTISGSQKTLAVAYQVWNQAFGASYLIMVPSILHHVSQLIVDSILASRWHKKS
jgi:solute carrier family 10 (sodium/bile acid cotransporter), member 7